MRQKVVNIVPAESDYRPSHYGSLEPRRAADRNYRRRPSHAIHAEFERDAASRTFLNSAICP